MTTAERIRAWFRQFVLGPGVVEPWEAVQGHDNTTYTPPEYGDYIATSNGVYACASLRAKMLSGLPLKLYRNGRNGKTDVSGGPEVQLLQKVNPFWTFGRLIEMTELSLCLWGEAFWFMERGQGGRSKPREIWWGRPDRVKVVPHVTDYISGFLYEPILGQAPLAFSTQEVVWLRYPNPIDEYSGLSPLAAARLGADLSSAAMVSNRNIFRNGNQMAGFIAPKAANGGYMTPQQAEDVSDLLGRRFKGVDNAHRVGVLRFDAQFQNVSFTPKDAEFLGALRWSLGEISRAYGVPPELVGDHENATYSNMEQAYKAVWETTMLPECRFIASEITEQLLPMFGTATDTFVEFDTSEVSALQPDETAEWTRSKEQITVGVITINEWREEQGKDPLPWGDVWWGPSSLTPIETSEQPEPEPPPMAIEAVPPAQIEAPQEEPEEPEPEEAVPPEPRMYRRRAVDFDGEQHRALWQRFVTKATKWEERIGNMTRSLWIRQRDSVNSGIRNVTRSVDAPYDRARWRREFAAAMRRILIEIAEEEGQAALAGLGIDLVINIARPGMAQFIADRALQFATDTDRTTWDRLIVILQNGTAEGMSTVELQAAIEAQYAEWAGWRAEAIARTETIGALNGARQQATDQAVADLGVKIKKTWITALDDRVRGNDAKDEYDHVSAHNQSVYSNEAFDVSGESLMYPGDRAGSAGNVINCRCSTVEEVI